MEKDGWWRRMTAKWNFERGYIQSMILIFKDIITKPYLGYLKSSIVIIVTIIVTNCYEEKCAVHFICVVYINILYILYTLNIQYNNIFLVVLIELLLSLLGTNNPFNLKKNRQFEIGHFCYNWRVQGQNRCQTIYFETSCTKKY